MFSDTNSTNSMAESSTGESPLSDAHSTSTESTTFTMDKLLKVGGLLTSFHDPLSFRPLKPTNFLHLIPRLDTKSSNGSTRMMEMNVWPILS